MKTILLLLLPILLIGQSSHAYKSWSTTLTGNSARPDTVEYRLNIGGVSQTSWTIVTDYITAAEKTAGTAQFISFADLTPWYWAEFLEIRIISQNATVAYMPAVYIGGSAGSVSASIVPGVVSGNTTYQVIAGGY